jgi:hypothetical protein
VSSVNMSKRVDKRLKNSKIVLNNHIFRAVFALNRKEDFLKW